MVSLYSGRVAQLGDGTPILAVYRILRMTQGTPVGEGSRPTINQGLPTLVYIR